jgi:hypothetical protein
MAANSSVLGIWPASDSFVAFTITMTRIGYLLGFTLYPYVERQEPKSTTGARSTPLHRRSAKSLLVPVLRFGLTETVTPAPLGSSVQFNRNRNTGTARQLSSCRAIGHHLISKH